MSAVPEKKISLMLVCGEPSGDQLGAQLMAGLHAIEGGNVAITGVGGPAMAAQGLQTLFALDDTAVMGLSEVVPKIPRILARVRQARDCALATRPDAVVLIDSPDFTHRIARALKRADPAIKTINYVAPQVWASRAYRARAMAKYFDLVLALLPFEAPFFERHGLKSTFVGHPVIERAARMKGGAELRARLNIPADAPLLAVLPGSRTNEIRFILPIFREAVRIAAKRIPNLVAILPTVPHVAARVRAAIKDWPTPIHLIESDDDKFAAFDAANAALAASGTVTTELALSRTPFVAAYRVGAVTYALGRWLFKLPYFTLVNLLLERKAVPEFLQADASPENLANAVVTLFQDAQAAQRQIADLEEAAHRLGEGGEPPSLRAARTIVDFVRASR
ncbi:MAG TPA: lipid-A-disaccharide synthase [Rhizomicrobium sp.]|nr:lipid-A-disaccharide synthase [Rhizomicrobium sp.]